MAGEGQRGSAARHCAGKNVPDDEGWPDAVQAKPSGCGPSGNNPKLCAFTAVRFWLAS